MFLCVHIDCLSLFSHCKLFVEAFSTPLFWIAVKWKIFEILFKFSVAPSISRKRRKITLLEQERWWRTGQACHWLSFFLRTGLTSYFPEDLKPFPWPLFCLLWKSTDFIFIEVLFFVSLEKERKTTGSPSATEKFNCDISVYKCA